MFNIQINSKKRCLWKAIIAQARVLWSGETPAETVRERLAPMRSSGRIAFSYLPMIWESCVSELSGNFADDGTRFGVPDFCRVFGDGTVA